jgi:hypothetical protein
LLPTAVSTTSALSLPSDAVATHLAVSHVLCRQLITCGRASPSR